MLGFVRLSCYHAFLLYTAGIHFGTVIQALAWYELMFIHCTLTEFSLSHHSFLRPLLNDPVQVWSPRDSLCKLCK